MTNRRPVFRVLGLITAIGCLLLGLAPVSAANANTNFASRCRYSHSAPDDPIVFPGQPGASHRHDFFGNRSTNASSTYNSLRRGATTCRISGDAASYWSPALYDSGRLITPTDSTAYYRLGGKDRRSIRAFPEGLKVVAKDNNVRAFWACTNPDGSSASDQTTTVPTCPDGTNLVLRYRFPDCWDGRRIDSSDHTSHMTFARAGTCPGTHPRPLPLMTLNVHYPTDGGEIVLGSPAKPVATHADFFNAWHQPTLERLVRDCLNAGRQCGTRPPGT